MLSAALPAPNNSAAPTALIDGGGGREEKDEDFEEELSLSNLHKFQKSREQEE